MLYLMHIVFGQFLTELWPLIDVRNLFMLNINSDCFFFFFFLFFLNFMKANSSNFQAICIGKNEQDGITSFNIDSVEIKCDDNVTFLGINTDFM